MTTIAIVHDYLTQRGGAERVVLSMLKAFPDADLYTSVFDPARTFEGFSERPVHTMPLNKIRVLRQHHRWGLPLYAPSFGQMRIDADVMIASSSGWAHGAKTSGRKIVYCYNPPRWLYQSGEYLSETRRPVRWGMRACTPALKAWDRRAASSADEYCAISTTVAERIRSAYAIAPLLLPPPPTITPNGPSSRPEVADGPFFLFVSRLRPYKNVDAVIAAFASTPDLRLVIAGSGSDADRLRQLAGPNVAFVGQVSDDELRWLYGHCTALVSASFEDYGLTPLEAATFGRPSVVIRCGGFLDTVVEGTTGLFFDTPSSAQIRRALRQASEMTWDAEAIERHAARFSEQNFIAQLRSLVHPPVAPAATARTVASSTIVDRASR